MLTPGADVRSIAALRDWLAALAKYRDEAFATLAGVDLEIRRAADWLAAQEQQWAAAVRQCERDMVQAKHELNEKRFPGYDGRMPDTTVEEKNLRKAEARLDHAAEKVKVCRRWAGRLPKAVEEAYTGPSRRLAGFLDAELPRATATLDRQVAALESYAQLRPDFAPAPSTLPPIG